MNMSWASWKIEFQLQSNRNFSEHWNEIESI